MQAAQLQHDEEQEEDDGAARDEQVLPVLPEAYGSQGREVIRIADCGLRIAKAIESASRDPHSAMIEGQ
jgi:hypothetical protein